jgi:hypothetical protein
MAFPTVQAADTKTGTQTSNSTTWTLTYPTNLAAGDLIIMLVAIDGDPSFFLPPTWDFSAEWTTGGPVNGFLVLKTSDGTESGNFTLTLGPTDSEQGAWAVLRVINWYGGMLSGGGNMSNTINFDGVGGTANYPTVQSANPNPLSFNPANWDSEDTLWIAACAVDASRTISAYPSDFPDNQTSIISGGASGATLGFATLGSNVASVDPGTFTISASDDWACLTVAIRPAAAAAAEFLYTGE